MDLAFHQQQHNNNSRASVIHQTSPIPISISTARFQLDLPLGSHSRAFAYLGTDTLFCLLLLLVALLQQSPPTRSHNVCSNNVNPTPTTGNIAETSADTPHTHDSPHLYLNTTPQPRSTTINTRRRTERSPTIPCEQSGT